MAPLSIETQINSYYELTPGLEIGDTNLVEISTYTVQ